MNRKKWIGAWIKMTHFKIWCLKREILRSRRIVNPYPYRGREMVFKARKEKIKKR